MTAAASAPHLFISYASADREPAFRVADALAAAGVQVWIDRRGIPGGAGWAAQITQAVRACRAVAVLCSEASMASRNVRQELQLAWDHGKPILPLLLEPVEFPDAVAYFLHGRQWIEVLDRHTEEWVSEAHRALTAFDHGDGSGGKETAPPAPPTSSSDAVPIPPTPTIGRSAEVEAITELLAGDARLVTLVGPGGVGKTRLALEVARHLRGGLGDGAWFVDLAPLQDPDLVLPAIAQTLGVRENGGESLGKLIHTRLRDKRLLLVLDNFEHVLGAATIVSELLAHAAGIRVLATSRAPLHLSGEHEVSVEPLVVADLGAVPTAAEAIAIPALQLFAERARAVKSSFALTEENVADVAAICSRLDGLPLAIELAAARVKLLPPNVLVARLEQRLPMLTAGPRDLPARQQTLRNTIAWSHDLLEAEEQMLFRRLAVFAGGCTFEAAETVAYAGEGVRGDVFDGLGSLMDMSLLREDAEHGQEPRFRMLDTVREFGLEQLAARGEESVARDRHAAYHLALAEQAAPEMAGPKQAAWMARIAAEQANLRAAMGWLVDQGDGEAALRLGHALWSFWARRGQVSEGRAWLERALAQGSGADPTIRARALQSLGNLAIDASDPGQACALYKASLALYRQAADERGIANALSGLGIAAAEQGDYLKAQALHEETLAARRGLGDERGTALSLHNLGQVAVAQGDHTGARPLHEEALAIRHRLGDTTGVAYSSALLGQIERFEGHTAAARTRLQQALALFEEAGDRQGVGFVLIELGHVAHQEDEAPRAVEYFRDALALRKELDDRSGVVECLEGLAGVAILKSQPEHAARLWSAAAAARDSLGVPLTAEGRVVHERVLAAARAALGETRFAATWTQGQAVPIDQAVAEALEVIAEMIARAGEPEL